MAMTSLYAGNNGKPLFNEFITPIGTAVHSYHDNAQPETDDKKNGAPVLDDKGIPKANFKVTLAWDKSVLDTELIPLRTLAATTRDQAWGPDCATDNWFRLEAFLRDGDNPEHNTKKREYLFGKVYLNFKAKAIPILQDGKFTGGYSGRPGLIGPYNEDLLPTDFWAGCKARVSGILFGTEYMGKKFISTRLNNIQKAADGERLGGGARPDAKSQFDPLMAGGPGGAGALAKAGNIL